MKSVVAALAFVIGLSIASTASADGMREWPGKHELTPHFGYQIGFGADIGSLYGFRLGGEYAYRFQQYVWFDAQIHNIFGVGPKQGNCRGTGLFDECYRGGWGVEIDAGVKVKLPVGNIPLVIEIPILLGVIASYNRHCHDDGAAVPAFKTGAGIRYFVTKRIGIGGNVNLSFGPSFHSSGAGVCLRDNDSYTDFYGAFDFTLGAEFIL